MNIKMTESSRIARYGTAFGELLYASWRALVEFLVPGDCSRRNLRGR